MELVRPIQWPAKYFKFYAHIKAASHLILNGTVLSIDPSSGGASQPGWALFRAGELIAHGEIKLPSKRTINDRLQLLYDEVYKLTSTRPDVLAIEDVSQGTMSHVFLRWAVGVSIAAARANVLMIVPINCWKAVAKASTGYEKTNAADAILIGKSIILLAQKFKDETNARISKSRRTKIRQAIGNRTLR